MNKPRVIKSYDKLPIELLEQIKSEYPYGFDKHLITFSDPNGKLTSAFPYETNDYHYLIKMTRTEAQKMYKEDIIIDLEEIEEIEEIKPKKEKKSKRKVA